MTLNFNKFINDQHEITAEIVKLVLNSVLKASKNVSFEIIQATVRRAGNRHHNGMYDTKAVTMNQLDMIVNLTIKEYFAMIKERKR